MSSGGVTELARMIGLHPESVRRNIRRGRIRAVRDLGGTWRIPPGEIERIRAIYAGGDAVTSSANGAARA